MHIVYCDSIRTWPVILGVETVSVVNLKGLPDGLWCVHVTDWKQRFCSNALGEARTTTLINGAKDNSIAILWYSGGDLSDFNPGFGEKYPFIVPHDVNGEHPFFKSISSFATSAADKQGQELAKALRPWIEQMTPSSVPEALVAAYLLLSAHEKMDKPWNELTFNHWIAAGQQYQKIGGDDDTDWGHVSDWDGEKIRDMKIKIGKLFSRVAPN